MPSVSVIIPAHNMAGFVGDALESVARQTYADLEVIVVDDGSTDDLAAALRAAPIPTRLVRQARQGVSAARNRGAAEAAGAWVAFLDADDVWRPQKIEAQLRALDATPGAAFSYTGFEYVDDGLRPIGRPDVPRSSSVLRDLLLVGNVVGTPSSVLIDKALLLACGGFDPSFSFAADWDLWIRLAMVTAFCRVPDVLVGYRRHAGAMSRNAPLIESDTRRVLESAFARPGLDPSLRVRRDEALARNYRVTAGVYYQAGQPWQAVRCALAAVRLNAGEAGYVLALPVRRLRAMRHASR